MRCGIRPSETTKETTQFGEREPSKARSATKQGTSKKRPGLSLRAKLYIKYRPLPPSSEGKNSPSASTSRTNSKNAKTPNESNRKQRNDNEDDGSTSDGSIDNYLVDPNEIDIESSFFNVDKANECKPSVSPVPNFDCNAGLGNLSDSESEDENNDSGNYHKTEDTKAFDFSDLLQNANSLERVKESLAKQAAEDAAAKKTGTPSKKSLGSQIDTMDVYSLLALGEKQHRSHNEESVEDDDEEEEDARMKSGRDRHAKEPSKLNKTKS
ncbi:DNA repair protein complementing XP-C cells homolog [Musca autumnalis]|uniref:DNA repair protein complementing XP-C cells homolog n=1 Tax=Musca autumnalis TaxID=221902 RepID=UPI003CF91DDE